MKKNEEIKNFQTIRFQDFFKYVPNLKKANEKEGLYLEMAKCKLPLIVTKEQYGKIVVGKEVGKWKPIIEEWK